MSFTGLLAVIVIGIIGLTVMGYSVDAWVNDTINALNGNIRDSETSIPSPQRGQIACDLYVDATWREKMTASFSDVNKVLFTNQDGKTITSEWKDCYQVGGISPSLTLLDFFNQPKEVAPLDLIIPNTNIVDEKYNLSFVLVDSNNLEKKLPHYQKIDYIVPAFNPEFDFQQKLVFRNIVLGDYTLKIIPEHARWWEHQSGEPYQQSIVAP